MMTGVKHIITAYLVISTMGVYSQKDPEHNILKGVAFSRVELHDSVIHYLGLAGEAMDAFPLTYIDYGRALMAKGQNQMALQEFMKAEKKETGLASFWIAKAYVRAGDEEKAIEYLDMNYKSRYREPESRILLDPDFQKLSDNEQWKEFWKNTGDPSTLEGILFEADYKLRSNHYTDALEILNGGIKRGLRKSPLHAKRADVYLAMDNYRMAANDLTTAIDGNRKDPNLYWKRAEANMKLERYKQAVVDYDQAIRLDPLELEFFRGRAEAYSRSGSYEPAVQDIKYYLTYFPRDPEGWYQAGMIHFSHQKYLNSLESFNKSIELNKNNAFYFAARGEAYMQTRTYRYAWNDFSMALDLNPVNPKVYLSKGIAAVNLGNLSDACNCFTMARRQGAYEAEEYLGRYCGGVGQNP